MENIKKAFESFNEKHTEYVKVSTTTRNEAERLIKSLIDHNGGDIDHDSELLDGICVSYDGGNHPEYASCICCSVMRIYLNGKKIYLDLEDESEYDLDRVSTEEIVWMCNDIITNFNSVENGTE